MKRAFLLIALILMGCSGDDCPTGSNYSSLYAEILIPEDGQYFGAGADINIHTGVCGIAPISRVEFYTDRSKAFTDTTYYYTWRWNNPPVGEHEILIIAYDSSGNQATDKVNITVVQL